MNIQERTLQYALQELLSDDPEALNIDRVTTFDEAGVLSHNAGLVIAMPDGQKFQVTIVQA